MNKQEQKTIIDAIDLVINEKMAKLEAENAKLLEEKNSLKEKISLMDKENKELKVENKQLTKDLNTAKKEVVKYEKIFATIKK